MSENTIAITRPSTSVQQSLAASTGQPVKMESKFPTETIPLPTKGHFYPSTHPLSSGKIELAQMTAKHEDILTSTNLLKSGKVLDKLIETLVVDKSISTNDLYICDKNALLIAVRRNAYGDKYGVTITCDSCGKDNKLNLNLADFNETPFDFSKYTRGENVFEFELPASKRTITYKLITVKEDESIDAEIKSLEKVSSGVTKEVTTRLKHILLSVDGNSDKVFIRNFVDNEMLSRDSLALRVYMRENTPVLDTTFNFVCQSCGDERRESMPIGPNFFWPTS